jgi:VWFA-related protein
MASFILKQSRGGPRHPYCTGMRTLFVFVIFALGSALIAQTPPQKPVEEMPAPIKVDVNVVNILASVHDKRGALVPNLEKNDFTVLEDGKPQTIKYFTRETNLPLTIGLLVDVSRSQENLIDIERSAASQFFAQVLRPKDEAFLISFGQDSELLQDYTNSARLLNEGLRGLRVNSAVGGIGPGPVPTADHPRGTVLYDAVYLAAHDKLRSEVGRKVIVVITDGVDEGSQLTLNQALESAQKADAVIYCIDYEDPGFYGMFGGFGAGGWSTLHKLSDETGGQVFKVDRKHSLQQVFQQIQDEMRSQYAIGYTPLNDARDGSYRHIEIKLAQKDLKAQARKGYYAVAGDSR